nr:copia protein [Tanacetum cinerariifolium]
IGGGLGMAKQSPSRSSGSVPVNDTVPFDTFDDTPVRGTRLLQKIYEREPMMTEEEVQDKYQQAGLLLLNKELTLFHEATKDIQWMESMHVKSAFLNGELKEEVYVTQPTDFDLKGKYEIVYKLNKALYGLRQAPRSWNAKLDKVLKELGFRRCAHEQVVYKLQSNSTTLIIGVKVHMDPKLQLTKDEGGKEVDPTKYRSIIGSLRYLLNICLDLIYSVEVVSKYMQSPTESHYAAVKKILRYLKGTTRYGLKYPKGGNGKICKYSDSSHASDIED